MIVKAETRGEDGMWGFKTFFSAKSILRFVPASAIHNCAPRLLPAYFDQIQGDSKTGKYTPYCKYKYVRMNKTAT